jgi:hypothetical protein
VANRQQPGPPARLSDDTIIARCHEGLWLVERDGATVTDGLTYDAAVAAATALA